MTEHPKIFSNQQLRDLAHVVAAAKIDWQRGFTGEIDSFRDVIQRLYTDDGHGDGRLAFRSSSRGNIFQLITSMTGPDAGDVPSLNVDDALAALAMPAANMVLASRKETTDAYESLINSTMTKIDTPLWRQQELVAPNQSILSEDVGLLDRYRYMFVRLLVPALETLQTRVARSEGEREGLLIGLALELYRREHKAWPTTLAELSPSLLPEVPLDRITGQPLHYKIVDERPIVYSVGVDQDDDSGRVAKNLQGELHPEYAEPNYYERQHEPVRVSEMDGDWVIWSTAPIEKRPPQGE